MMQFSLVFVLMTQDVLSTCAARLFWRLLSALSLAHDYSGGSHEETPSHTGTRQRGQGATNFWPPAAVNVRAYGTPRETPTSRPLCVEQ